MQGQGQNLGSDNWPVLEYAATVATNHQEALYEHFAQLGKIFTEIISEFVEVPISDLIWRTTTLRN